MDEFKYEAPAWVTVPDYCADKIQHQYQVLIQGSAGVAASFDGTHVIVHYDGSLDLGGTSADGMKYTVSIMV